MRKFYQFFRLRKVKNNQHFTWNDEPYSKFIMNMLSVLEPRFELKNTILLDEMDEVNELMFINRGKVGIGYSANKKKKYCVKKTDMCVIGTYGMVFD